MITLNFMNVSVFTINSKTSLNTILGSVYIKQSSGEVEGNITLPLNGTIDMSLTNGQIKLEIPQNTSASYSANTVNGSISLSNLILDNIVDTSNSMQGTLGNGQGIISLKTANGNIQVSGK